MRSILPVAVSGCFVESRVVLQWGKNTLSAAPNNREQPFLSKINASKCFSTTRKKDFLLGLQYWQYQKHFFLSSFFFLFFSPQLDWDSSWHLRNVGAKNVKFSELFLNTGWVSTALLAWDWTLISASPHSKASWGWFEPKWIQQGVQIRKGCFTRVKITHSQELLVPTSFPHVVLHSCVTH